MPTEDNNKLQYKDGEKSLKAPFVIYDDLTNKTTILINPVLKEQL